MGYKSPTKTMSSNGLGVLLRQRMVLGEYWNLNQNEGLHEQSPSIDH